MINDRLQITFSLIVDAQLAIGACAFDQYGLDGFYVSCCTQFIDFFSHKIE